MKWIYTIILIVGALLVDIGAGAKTVEVTLTQAGTLNAALSDNGMQIDPLVVKGPIDSVDFHTMWYYSYHGKLEVLDICNYKCDSMVIGTCSASVEGRIGHFTACHACVT